MTISVFLVTCNHIKSVTEGSRSRNTIGCTSLVGRAGRWVSGRGAVALCISGLYSSLFVISFFTNSTITTIIIINFISVTKLFLPRGEVSERLCGTQVPAGLNHGTAIHFKAFNNISMTYLPAKFSEEKPKKPYLAHTNMEDTALQIDILFYLLHTTD